MNILGFVLIALLVVVLVLVVQDRKTGALVAELEAGGDRRDAALASMPSKGIREKLREAGISTKRTSMPLRVKLKERSEKESEERKKFEPFSDNLRASRLN